MSKKLRIQKLVQIVIAIYSKLIRTLAGLFFRTRETDVIIVLKKLGDTVFAIPAVIEIAKKSKKRLVVVCYESNAAIIRKKLDCEFEILKPKDFFLSGRLPRLKTLTRLYKLNPQIIYDLTGNSISAGILLFFTAPSVIGFNEKEIVKGLYTNFIKPYNKPHLVAMYLRVSSPELSINEMAVHWDYPAKLNNNGYILIHPFAGWKAKEWNIRKFYQLAKILKEQEFKIRIVSAHGEMDDDVIEEIDKAKIEYSETQNIDQLINLIENSSVVIGNDSAAVQIGKLLGKPTFTICGPTHPRFYKASNSFHEFIFNQVPCSPGYEDQYCFTFAGRKGCPAFQCMDNLSVTDVENKLLLFFQKIGFTSEVIKNV